MRAIVGARRVDSAIGGAVTFEQDLGVLVRLVIDNELEDLDRTEKRVLLRMAHHVDKTLNNQALSNKHRDRYYEEPSHLAREAGCADAKCRICNLDPERSTLDAPDPKGRPRKL